MSKLVVLIAAPRTGTNYIYGLLNKSFDIKSMAEIFHKKKPYGLELELISKAVGIAEDDLKKKEASQLAVLVRENAPEILKQIKRYYKQACFKIFQNQLPWHIYEEYIINDDDIAKIFIDRSPIDMYISAKKAITIGKYNKVDTTHIKPAIKAQDFLTWFTETSSWYHESIGLLNKSGQIYGVANYDELCNGKIEDQFKAVKRVFSSVGVDLNIINKSPSNLFEKQDTGYGGWESKVSNSDEFLKTLGVYKILVAYRGFIAR